MFDINVSRSLWRSYSRQSDLLMFVVDLEDRERLDEAKLEMGRMIRILGKSVPIMVLANKMDLPGEIETYCCATSFLKSIYEKSSDLFLYYRVSGSGSRNVEYVLTRLRVK